MTETDREERRARREEKRHHFGKPDTDGEGFTTDPGPAGGTSPEIEDAEARRAARKARHAARRADEEKAREAGIREAELRETEQREADAKRERARQKRARDEEERAERRREEKRARKAAREELRAKEEQEAKEAEARAEAKAAERHERRRTRDSEEMNGVSRRFSKSDRRHSGLDRQYPEEYAPERRHHRSHRSGDEAIRSRYRKPVAREPVEAPYFATGGKDKTSSWVHSQMAVPPEAPPIVPTELDLPPGAEAHSLSSDEEARRKLRHQARRRTKQPGLTDEEMEDVRTRRRESKRADHKSSSASGDYDRDRGSRAVGGRYGPRQANGGEKRTSWFKKLTSLT